MASSKFGKSKSSRNHDNKDDSKSKRDARRSRFDEDKISRRGSRSKRDSDEKRSRSDDRSERLSGLNDFSWYNQYPTLLSTAASIPFPYRPGMNIPMAGGTFATSSSDSSDFSDGGYTIPGVLALSWFPSVGQSSLPTDPASIVGKEVYAAVRKVYSGSIDADAPDFVMYLMALDSIFSYIGSLKRVYRTINAYSPDNFVLPDTLLSALGLNSSLITSIRQNPMDFARTINELVLQSQKFRCPAIMDVFNRHYWLNDNVYTDANSILSQFYVFRQTGFFKLNASAPIPNDTTNTAAGLTMTASPFATVTSYTSLYDFGISLINALDAWDDGYMISGYLMRAFEGTPSFAVDQLDLSEILTPVYVEEVLTQIENARTAFVGVNASDCGVYQNPTTNAIIHQPIVSAPSIRTVGCSAYLPATLSLRSDVPTVEEVVIASRLHTLTAEGVTTPIIKGTLSSGHKVVCGTEILNAMNLYGCGFAGSTRNNVSIHSVIGLYASYTQNWENINLPAYFALSNFDWHPITFIGYQPGGTSNPVQWIANGDTHNMTVLTEQQFTNINRVCLFSEFKSFLDVGK